MHAKELDGVHFRDGSISYFNKGISGGRLYEKVITFVLSAFMQILLVSSQLFTDTNSLFVFIAISISALENQADNLGLSLRVL